MTLASRKHSAPGGAKRSHLACDVVTEVEPPPGRPQFFVFAAVIGRARARAYWSRKSPG
jgi:hypothetical protein